jgi:hypothetical protein
MKVQERRGGFGGQIVLSLAAANDTSAPKGAVETKLLSQRLKRRPPKAASHALIQV